MQVDDLEEQQDPAIPANEAPFLMAPRRGDEKNLVIPSRTVGFHYLWEQARVQLIIGAFDLAAVAISLCSAFLIVTWFGKTANHFFPFLACVSFAQLFSYWLVGLNPGVGLHPAEALRRYVHVTTVVSLALLLSLLLLTNPDSPYVWMLLVAFPIEVILLPLGRFSSQSAVNRLGVNIPFYFLGTRQNALRAFHLMGLFGKHVLQPTGRFVFEHAENDIHEDFEPLDLGEEMEVRFERTAVYKGTIDDLLVAAQRENVYWLLVVEDRIRCVNRHERSRLQKVFPQLITITCPHTDNSSIDEVATYGALKGVRDETRLLMPWNALIKRAIDLSMVAVSLPLVLPLAALLMILIRVSSRGPVLFFHERIGKNGHPFRAWKFRTMVANAQQVLDDYLASSQELRDEWNRDHKLRHDPRITWIGWLLRKSSLDELPQLWNVVTGEMSLVGPRPIVNAEIPKYADTYHEYIRVTPGITGLWQISGRNNTTYGERLLLDRYYVRNWSPWLDLYILLRTVKTVLLCEGAY